MLRKKKIKSSKRRKEVTLHFDGFSVGDDGEDIGPDDDSGGEDDGSGDGPDE